MAQWKEVHKEGHRLRLLCKPANLGARDCELLILALVENNSWRVQNIVRVHVTAGAVNIEIDHYRPEEIAKQIRNLVDANDAFAEPPTGESPNA